MNKNEKKKKKKKTNKNHLEKKKDFYKKVLHTPKAQTLLTMNKNKKLRTKKHLREKRSLICLFAFYAFSV